MTFPVAITSTLYLQREKIFFSVWSRNFTQRLNYNYRCETRSRFDPALVGKCLEALSPDAAAVILSSRDAATANAASAKVTKKERWFGTRYTSEEIPPEWKSLWRSAAPARGMRLPEPNRYLVEDAKLRPLDLNLVLEHPTRVVGERAGELFYKRDVQFGRPEAYVLFRQAC